MRRADGLWHLILPAFGIGAEYLKNRHGPCPACGGKDRFRYDDKGGRGTWFCGGGGSPSYGDGYGLIAHAHGWDNGRAYHEVQQWLEGNNPPATPLRPKAVEPPKIQQYALRLWPEAGGGVEFHPYAKAKGITGDAGAKRHRRVSGRVVGHSTDCILVPIRDLANGEVVAVQAINPSGKKQTFGPIRGNGFVCGNTLDKTLDWYVVEGWADAVSMVFHHGNGNACAFAACGANNMEILADKVAEIYRPNRIVLVEDAA